MFKFNANIVIYLVIFLILWSYETVARIVLPQIPNVVHPPLPDEAKLDKDTAMSFANDPNVDPEIRPGLYQGDMAIDNENYKHWRIGLRWDVFPEKIWANRTVPYVISPLYEPSDIVTIYKAIRILNYMTCLNFIPWNGKKKDYLVIWPIKYPKGCWSYIGRIGGPQIVSLQPPDKNGPNCLGIEGRAIHELMHAIGIFHEQSRWDRDKFVKIHTKNIVNQFLPNFEKQNLENTTYSFEYDYNSIMHYGKYYFSKGRNKPTITPKKPEVYSLGQRKALSKTDCLKINDLYGCLNNVKLSKKYYNLCQFMGI